MLGLTFIYLFSSQLDCLISVRILDYYSALSCFTCFIWMSCVQLHATFNIGIHIMRIANVLQCVTITRLYTNASHEILPKPFYWFFFFFDDCLGEAEMYRLRRPTRRSHHSSDGTIWGRRGQCGRWREPVSMATPFQSDDLFCPLPVCQLPWHGARSLWKGDDTILVYIWYA